MLEKIKKKCMIYDQLSIKMKVYFWGTRGSVPSSFSAINCKEKVRNALLASLNRTLKDPQEVDAFVASLPFSAYATYGTSTPCVEIETESTERLVLDAGSGLRNCGINNERLYNEQLHFHILLSHLHWDHIQGFPLFSPLLHAKHKITLHSYHPQVQEMFTMMMSAPGFPLPLEHFDNQVNFIVHGPGQEFEVAGFQISAIEQNHPGASYAYRCERNGKSLVYSTDCEHKLNCRDDQYPHVKFFKNADLVIFDAMSSLQEEKMKGWGHSHTAIGIDLCLKAESKRLLFFHHDPDASDSFLDQIFQAALHYKAKVDPENKLSIGMAYDTLVEIL